LGIEPYATVLRSSDATSCRSASAQSGVPPVAGAFCGAGAVVEAGALAGAGALVEVVRVGVAEGVVVGVAAGVVRALGDGVAFDREAVDVASEPPAWQVAKPSRIAIRAAPTAALRRQ
jgi:hypothetical protein